MSNIALVIAATETRLQNNALLVESAPHETTEDAILWLRRETKARRALGLTVELRRYSIDGGATWFDLDARAKA